MNRSPVSVGDQVPQFTLIDENGNKIDINDFIGRGPMVIYFYPKDDTPGCTIEACSFRDQFGEFQDLGANIFGISSDTPQSHREFKEKYNLQYTLLSDPDRMVQSLFGVKRNFLGLLPGRATYVVDNMGKVIYIFESQLQPKKHITEALNILKGH